MTVTAAKVPQLSGDSRISTVKGTSMPVWVKVFSLVLFLIHKQLFLPLRSGDFEWKMKEIMGWG